MKQIIAIIQPHRLSRIRAAARRVRGFPGMTVDKVEGFSPVDPSNEQPGIEQELVDYSPKVRLTVLAPDESVDEIVRLITGICHTGEKGDGVIWVSPVERVVRLRDASPRIGG